MATGFAEEVMGDLKAGLFVCVSEELPPLLPPDLKSLCKGCFEIQTEQYESGLGRLIMWTLGRM